VNELVENINVHSENNATRQQQQRPNSAKCPPYTPYSEIVTNPISFPNNISNSSLENEAIDSSLNEEESDS